MKKNKGIRKLRLEKITVSKLTHLHLVRGGSHAEVVIEAPHSENVGGSLCVCTVTIALSKDCDADDYDPFANF